MIKRLSRKIVGFVPVKPYLLKTNVGVVSFTFDDIPRSAGTVGGSILSKKGVAGTYDICGNLTDGRDHGRPCHTRADLEALVQDGHELGTHTFRHLPTPDMSHSEFDSDADEGDAFIQSIGCPRPRSFAYPFGLCDLKSKLRVAERYATGRGIRPGLNEGWVDLAQLKAVGLYSRRIDEAGARALIDNAIKRRAWLIFYTHDVSDTPSEYGCTPALLSATVAHAITGGARTLPVKNALGAVAFSNP